MLNSAFKNIWVSPRELSALGKSISAMVFLFILKLTIVVI